MEPEFLNCPEFYSKHFLELNNKEKFCAFYWSQMRRFTTLKQALTSLPANRIPYRCALIVLREKKCRWPEVEFLIAQTSYSKGLYLNYMKILVERNQLTTEEFEDILNMLK
jgi:hypothetical protein